MKILLFGEFSGFMNCLKDGLLQLGHEVFLASDGDGFKDYASDFRWDYHFGNKIPKVKKIIDLANIWWHKELLCGYDIVLFISPHYLGRPIENKPVYEYILKNNCKTYLSGSGLIGRSFDFWYKSDTKYKYYCEGILLDDSQKPSIMDANKMKWDDEFMSKIDGYIPIWYEYAEPFRTFPNIKKTIRIPVNISQFNYKPNVLHNNKVVFYHGITRPCKGTRFIKPAFEKMQKHFGDKAEFIIAEKLPFEEYMKVVEKTNVIVDDANSFSVAMNALFNMLKGKLIMGGAEEVANEELGISGVNPVFNINPDVDQICDTIENIIRNKERIEEWGCASRSFVEKYHNSVDVARQYVELWEKDLNESK